MVRRQDRVVGSGPSGCGGVPAALLLVPLPSCFAIGCGSSGVTPVRDLGRSLSS